MKIRPLPELDLARIAPLPREQKRRALEQMKLKRPPYSYDPMRRSVLEVLNVDAGPLGAVPRAPWAKIESEIAKRSRSSDEERANLGVAHALYEFAAQAGLSGRKHEFYPWAIGVVAKVSYWLPAVVALDGKPTILLVDPRRAKKLTSEGRRFAFSAMHERIRAADPDFADAELGIIQFSANEDGTRSPVLSIASGVKLFDYEALDHMVRETYEIWFDVLEEREAESRRAASGMRGPLI